MQPRKIDEPFEDRAEGLCNGLPYTTELVSSEGVSVHFWTGDLNGDHLTEALAIACDTIRRKRDVVRIQYSTGEPTGFWAHLDC